MGGTLSKKMESVMRENMKENQEFMLAAQRMQVGPTTGACAPYCFSLIFFH